MSTTEHMHEMMQHIKPKKKTLPLYVADILTPSCLLPLETENCNNCLQCERHVKLTVVILHLFYWRVPLIDDALCSPLVS